MISSGSPCSEESLNDAAARLGVALPPPVRTLFCVGDGRFDQAGQWWVVWRLTDLVANNLSAWANGVLPRSLIAFGDDGTGNPFCVHTDGSDLIVRWSWIDREPDMEIGTVDDFVAGWLV